MDPRHRVAPRSPVKPPAAKEPPDALTAVERSIQEAWEDERRMHPDEDDVTMAQRIVADPSHHLWRLVDAALMRLRCDDCGSELGAGPVGCGPCDLAHGFRLAAREPDRPGVPPGNEHAIRVPTAVLRAPHRYPDWAVEANRIHLPLFLAGEMPTRREQEAMVAARRRGAHVDVTGVRSFGELAARAEAAGRRG